MFSLRQAIPGPIKKAVKSVIDPIKSAARDRQLRTGIEALRRGDVSRAVIEDLRDAWGNKEYSADLLYIEEAAKLAQRGGPMLECGTGLTTLICGVLCERKGTALYGLEQDAEWLDKVRRVLVANRINAHVFHAPLRRYDDHVWHDLTGISLPNHFGSVICDGPAVHPEWGTEAHKAWRYGVLPALRRARITYDALLLDDVDEARGPGVLERWRQEFGTKHEVRGADRDFCALVFP